MAKTLTTQLALSISGSHTNSDDVFGATEKRLSKSIADALANGVGASQADLCVVSTGTVDSTGTTLDLVSGGLVDAFGAAVSFAELAGILVVNSEDESSGHDLLVGGAAAPIANIFADGTDKLRIGPGGVALLWNPATGYVVTTGTADGLKLAAAGAYTCAYELLLIGRSA